MRIENLRVLIVEDQEDALESMKEMLGEIGILNIISAVDGKQALEMLNADGHGINMVMCDWNMPVMSGIELLESLRKAGRKIPFLMMTGRNDTQSVVDAKSKGVTLYLSKPFTIDELEQKLVWIFESMLNYDNTLSELKSVGS